MAEKVVWQPSYADLDSSGLDLNAESNTEIRVIQDQELSTGDELAGAVDSPYILMPDKVFAIPQRVWLPIPSDVNPDDVQLYYYYSDGVQASWYPAEDVVGWLEPGSMLVAEFNGTRYLGFLVRHSGLVQLALPSQTPVVRSSEAAVLSFGSRLNRNLGDILTMLSLCVAIAASEGIRRKASMR
jgi:hypothetical protein